MQHFHTTSDEYSVIFTAGCTAALKLIAECFDFHGNCCQGNKCKSDASTCSDKTCCNGDSSPTKVHCHGDDSSLKSDSHDNGSFSYLLDNHTSVQGMREPALRRAGRVQCLDVEQGDTVVIKSILHLKPNALPCGNHLFAYPAQSNFNGRKYSLSWINMAKQGQMEWQSFIGTDRSRSQYCQGHVFTVLDAASFVSTSPLNLQVFKPDFVTLSFYKIFGYPTGLGNSTYNFLIIISILSSIHILKASTCFPA